MGFSRVLLVSPDHADSNPEHPQLGLGCLSEALEQKGIEHAVLDMRLGGGPDALKSAVREFQPDLVGFSMKTLLYRQTYEMVEGLERDFPGVAMIAGGPHVSTYREQVLRECQALDYAVTLEGENTLLELCDGADPRGIRGLLYRENGAVAYAGDRSFIEELDAVPFPKYRRFPLDRYATDEIPLLTSRGCPYACIFCAAKAAAGRRFKARSARHVADEMQYWYDRGRRRFAIIDDNFTLKKARVLQLCREIEERGFEGLEIRCPNGVRADRVDEELLRRMRSVGFSYLAFGVESGSDRILEGVKKGESLDAIRRSIRLACDLGYEVALFFIVGFPGETWEDIEASVSLARSYPVVDAKFFNLVPLPGTDLFRWVSRNNYFTTPPEEYLNHPSHWQNDARWDPKPVFATPEMPLGQRVKALAYVAQAQREIRRAAEARLNGG
jgi:anaerobic magnesium-protoporphyrin IX monomethyl ester cyclase